MNDDSSKPNKEKICQALNLETAKISWNELQRYYAKGLIIKVSKEADLIGVAAKIINNDDKTVTKWLDDSTVTKATDEDAIHWHETQAELWSVVTAPWVLVQEIAD